MKERKKVLEQLHHKILLAVPLIPLPLCVGVGAMIDEEYCGC